MENESKVANWLKKLQQNSWEPEIFISGIIIFSLFQIPDLLDEYRKFLNREVDVGNNFDLVFSIVDAGIYWLIFGFTFHLFSRGVWGSLIGLSYVFPEGIKKERIKYVPRFQKRVEKLQSLEENINRLEKLSSSIFSITFLLFMSMIAVGLWILFLIVLLFIFFKSFGLVIWGIPINTIMESFSLIYIIFSLMYLIDFVGLGLLKKNRYVAYLFFPIHWFFSKLALSGLYTQVYYTFVTNFKKWKIITAILIYILVSMITVILKLQDITSVGSRLSSITFFNSNAFFLANADNYDDQNGINSQSATIPSDMVDGDILRLFIVHFNRYEVLMKDSCNLNVRLDTVRQGLDRIVVIKDCLKQLYSVYVDDSLINNLDFVFHIKSPHQQKGFLNWIDIGYLPKGLHHVTVRFKFGENENLHARIPFYKISEKRKTNVVQNEVNATSD